MPTLESTVNKIVTQLKIQPPTPREENQLKERMEEYIQAAQKGKEDEKAKLQKELENIAKACKVKPPELMKALDKFTKKGAPLEERATRTSADSVARNISGRKGR